MLASRGGPGGAPPSVVAVGTSVRIRWAVPAGWARAFGATVGAQLAQSTKKAGEYRLATASAEARPPGDAMRIAR